MFGAVDLLAILGLPRYLTLQVIADPPALAPQFLGEAWQVC